MEADDRKNYPLDWFLSPRQVDQLPLITGTRRNLSILEPGPWHGEFTRQFLEQGQKLTCVEPWLGPEAEFNSRTYLHDQCQLDRMPIEQFLAKTDQHWDLTFAPGLLYHVPSPLHLLDLFVQHSDHVVIDTWPWVKTVEWITDQTRNFHSYWDHKGTSLVAGPRVLDHYMTKTHSWIRGWQGLQRKYSGYPIWTAYYYKPEKEPLDQVKYKDYTL